MTTIYDVGDKIRISFNFIGENGAAIDPTTVTLILKNKSSIVATWVFGVDPEIINTAVGSYYADYIIPTRGYWSYNITGTGVVSAADTEFFISKA